MIHLTNLSTNTHNDTELRSRGSIVSYPRGADISVCVLTALRGVSRRNVRYSTIEILDLLPKVKCSTLCTVYPSTRLIKIYSIESRYVFSCVDMLTINGFRARVLKLLSHSRHISSKNSGVTKVIAVTATPADRSSGALSLAVALESMGLVHFIVRRADEHNGGVIRDHTIVRKGILDANNTSASPTSPRGGAATGVVDGPVKVVETVEGLEPNATYEVMFSFGAGQTIPNSAGRIRLFRYSILHKG